VVNEREEIGVSRPLRIEYPGEPFIMCLKGKSGEGYLEGTAADQILNLGY
jgi:hypothetical protein